MLKYVNIVGCFLYGLIILAIMLSHDKSFRTPFWIFFISGGVKIFDFYRVLFLWNSPHLVALLFIHRRLRHLLRARIRRRLVVGCALGYLSTRKRFYSPPRIS